MLENEIEKIVESCGAKLYDIETVSENGKTIYRVTITDDKGVDLEQCAKISNLISPLLDVNPPIKGDYNLEVSSPGVERKLKKIEHFKNSLKESVKITLDDGSKVKGEIRGVEDDKIVLKTEDGEEKVDFNRIENAKTIYNW